MKNDKKTQEKGSINSNHAIQIGERIWWVGHYLPDDPFQCHVYLIENGNQSVLIDPGSPLTFESTLKKIESIIPFQNIRYFIFHHQDPDITSAMLGAEKLITRKDARIVTHWRAETLLKHYDFSVPFWRVEENNWELNIGTRRLRFIFTPYLHFPGAFCTFDETSGILFSSDLFGGFTEGFQLFAEDETYFEAIRPFHEHYMPSREILQYGIQQLEEYPVRMIAPQHGSIIKNQLVPFIFKKLKNLDCGLFAYARKDIDIHRLSKLNKSLREITNTMILYREFREIAKKLLRIIRNYLYSAQKIEFYTTVNPDVVLKFCEENRYRSVKVKKLPHGLDEFHEMSFDDWMQTFDAPYLNIKSGDRNRAILIPLFSSSDRLLKSAAVLTFSGDIEAGFELKTMVEQISLPLEIALEREIMFYLLDEDRQRYYRQTIHDPLTGLYTRFYIYDALQTIFLLHDRDESISIGLILADLDDFRNINDTYGHMAGDEVLKEIAAFLSEELNQGDLAVRMGGEEFALFIFNQPEPSLLEMAEKIRKKVESRTIHFPDVTCNTTVSMGVSQRHRGEPLSELISRTDRALFVAKSKGKNCIGVAKPGLDTNEAE